MTTEKQRLTFISYARDDADFALELARELKASGFLVWLDQLDIPTGARWDDEVQKALEQCEIFMVILTPNSIASNNVKDEIGYVIDANKRILPVLLENANIPFRLRRFQYVDFTNKSYNEGIDIAKQLLRKLQDEPTGPVPAIQSDFQNHKAKAESERIAAQKVEADRLARQRAEALRAAREKEQLERRSQVVPSVQTNVKQVSQPQAQKRPAPKFIPIFIGIALILLLCSTGGIYVYNIIASSTETPVILQTTEAPPQVATTLPPPISTTEAPPIPDTDTPIPSTFFPQEPDQFIIFYWETIIYDKDYELAWSLLTEGFKRKNNPNGYEDWKNTMVKVINWDRPTSLNTNSISSSMVTVHFDSIHFYSINSREEGYFLRNIIYCMIRDESRFTWVIEDAEVCRG